MKPKTGKRRAPAAVQQFSLNDRSSGVLLHVTSLPGPYYTGDFGPAAFAFVDFLAKAQQRWWQMLPINPIGDGNSPYATVSSFAGEPLLIDLTELVAQGLLRKSELEPPAAGSSTKANYAASRRYRSARLHLAFARAEAKLPTNAEWREFCAAEHAWLDDFTLFAALSEHYGTTDWSSWPEPVKSRQPAALAAARLKLSKAVQFRSFEQFIFAQQWQRLKAYANERGVGLIGDLPIFVSHGSADVWANAGFFRLDAAGQQTVVAGCPPDAFNRDGQRWGNALYDWPALSRDKFRWWLRRLGRATTLFDAVRLDHFIGFARYWEIPASAKTARQGRWIDVPGDAFFKAVKQRLGSPQFIAEDLGAVTPAVRALRDKYGFPGMKVLQFAFDGTEEADQHKPHQFPPASVAYTGTHDNNTSRGWYVDLQRRSRGTGSAAKKISREANAADLYLAANAQTVHWAMLRAAFASQARVVITPMQDLLGEGSGSRMNIPGKATGNWRYRVKPSAITQSQAQTLGALTALYDRTPRPPGKLSK